MSDLSTVARPYARAVFDLARESGALSGWSDRLACIAAVAGSEALADLLDTPGVEGEQLAEVVNGICSDRLGDRFDDQGRNLVRLLAHNRRLAAAPDVAETYEALRADAEGTVEAVVESASPLDDAQREKLREALHRHLGRDVKLDFKVNEDLIGGAVVRAGDWVVDASARAQLEKLVGALGAA